MDLSVVLKTLGDDIRLRIFGLLLQGELCVCDIETILEISQANASRHLTRMKSAGILSSRKNAQWVYYNISVVFNNVYSDFSESLEAVLMELPEYKKDIKTLNAVKKEKNRKC